MRFYESTFFCDDGKFPRIHVHHSKDEQIWPVTLTINFSEEEYHKPAIKFHIYSIEDLIRFRNSVMFAVDKITFAIDNPEEDSSNV